MKNLCALIASELSEKADWEATTDNNPKGDADDTDATVSQVLLQLTAIPIIIEIDKYRNAQSSANPSGSYRAAYQSALLSDAVPLLSPDYIDSLNSVSKIWGNIVNTANTSSEYTQQLFEEAKNTYNLSKLSGFGGIPENWFSVLTIPYDWCDLLDNDANLTEIEIDVINGDTDSKDFLVLNGDSSVSWKIYDSNETCTEIPLHTNSMITKIHLKVLRVDFYRSWLNIEILNTQEWKIDGLEKGHFSNGTLIGNTGSFPLIPQSVLIGSEVKITGDFHPEDLNIIADSKASDGTVFMETFALKDMTTTPFNAEGADQNTVTLTSNVKQVLGYISRLVPECPPLSGN
ncbi:hypothetical protein [Flavobacterium poyangense]|uniref:hypothetical protein n=1 Tax=Flavobacterium poyangense TaxID=2204302 RepID=UPI00141DD338|nr:hypothetical protein [Flavobacterium sp. JXAS1]